MNKDLKYKVGYVMLVKTFAGPTIQTRVKNIIDYKTKIGGEEVTSKGSKVSLQGGKTYWL